jgi:hypothetical protein
MLPISVEIPSGEMESVLREVFPLRKRYAGINKKKAITAKAAFTAS